MNNYHYQFEKHPAPKGPCPRCHKARSFRYYNGLPREYGRCERQNHCGYHAKPGRAEVFDLEPPPDQLELVIVYPEPRYCLLTLNNRTSNFHLFCEKKLAIPEEHLRKWNIGSRDNTWNPARPLTAFIYRDKEGKDLNMRFFEYDEFCKRNKKRKPFSLKNDRSLNAKYSLCLYGEHLLESDKIICLVESEKTAVIASYFYPQFDWLAAGSSNGLTARKCQILTGRKVYYLCDADKAGRQNSTINSLHKHSIDFTIVDLFPGRDDGYDLADALTDKLKPEIVPAPSDKEPSTKEDAVPLPHSTTDREGVSEKTPSFPVEVFPEPIRKFIEQSAETLNFPVDFVAAGVLASFSVAIGNKFKIQIKKGWIESVVLYLAIVGSPGVRKTPALNTALRPIIDRQTELHQENELEMKEYEMKKEEYDKDRDNNDKPVKPVLRQILTTDATMEALILQLYANPAGMLLFRDELIGWNRDFNRYNKGSDEQCWLSIWSNQPIFKNRVSQEEKICVKKPFVSVIGGIQPKVLAELFENKKSINGFTDRLLFAFPDKIERKFVNRDMDESVIADYNSAIRTLLDIEAPIDGHVVEPYILSFSNLAFERFARWDNEVICAEINKNSTSEQLQGIYAKIEAYMPRLSLIVHLMYRACGLKTTTEVDLESAEAGIRLTAYFKSHAIKVLRIVRRQKTISTFDAVLNWIQKQDRPVTKRDLQRSGVPGVVTVQDAAYYFDLTVEEGLGFVRQVKPSGGGTPYQELVLHPTPDT